MKHHDILIVGSGVIGTTLANSLKSDDLSIGIIDSEASPKFSKRHLTERKKFYKDAEYPFSITKVDYQ